MNYLFLYIIQVHVEVEGSYFLVNASLEIEKEHILIRDVLNCLHFILTFFYYLLLNRKNIDDEIVTFSLQLIYRLLGTASKYCTSSIRVLYGSSRIENV